MPPGVLSIVNHSLSPSSRVPVGLKTRPVWPKSGEPYMFVAERLEKAEIEKSFPASSEPSTGSLRKTLLSKTPGKVQVRTGHRW